MSIWKTFRPLFFAFLVVPQVSLAISLATPEEDRRAKQALPPSGKALLYVYRGASGARVSPTVLLNNKELGALEPRTYYMMPVSPGRVDLRAGSGRTLSIRAQDGRVYFIELSVDSIGNGGMAQVSYGRGRQDVHSARLVRGDQATTVASRPESNTDHDAAPGEGRAGFNLILKAGSFSLASGSQTVLATPLSISTGSTAIGLEGEWITASGWAFGAEYLGHSHSYTSGLGNGDMQATTITINFKKYFRYGSTVQPYVGAGLGSAVSSLSGGINGSAAGAAVQVVGGAAFRSANFGGYTELKYQSAKTEDSNGETVDIGGMGFFAGVSVLF